ncbi:hypothetical protein NBRC116188_08570 [Oceaniserpentilla sp. 4NH20-0058]|uniref:GGDEF domain-containing protein n=1 Tax=Oceaniserpentilla sp. 4NH20-0058 TaxID=3127660 RepID=UPI0031024425
MRKVLWNHMDSYLIKRTDMDFLNRSFPGLFVYASVWPTLAWGSGYFQVNFMVAATFSALFIIISILRIIHVYSTPYFYQTSTSLWRALLLILAFSHALTLSSLQVYLVIENTHHDMIVLSAIILVGLLSGAVPSLAPKKWFTQIYVGVVLAPTIIACSFTSEYRFLAPLFIVMWIYYIYMCNRYHNEYARAFYIEMELKENQKKLERLNQTDTLTGIYNRQYFDNALDLQWNLAHRSQSYIAILFLDLDFFKKINDEYGHLIGDKALCHAATILKETAKRKTDMVARYGGEEFAIILPSTHHQTAKELAQTIRQKIEQTPLVHGSLTIHLTASVGVNCMLPNNQTSCMVFLDQADRALYEAKHSGRNRVVSFLDINN